MEMTTNNKSYYMVFANDFEGIKRIVHKVGSNRYQLYWNNHCYGGTYPYSVKRLAFAKIVANKVKMRFGNLLTDIYVSKITPSDNEKGYIEEKVYSININ